MGQYWGNTKKSPAKSLTFSVSSRYILKFPHEKLSSLRVRSGLSIYIQVCLTFVPTSRGVCPPSLNSLAFFTPIIGDLGRFSITVQEQLCTIILNEIRIFQHFNSSGDLPNPEFHHTMEKVNKPQARIIVYAVFNISNTHTHNMTSKYVGVSVRQHIRLSNAVGPSI